MKFLAILSDSVREAIDFKVFYVMIGLSLVLALLALSLGFVAEPGGDEVVRDYAVLGLSDDTGSLEQAAALHMLFQTRPIQFTVKSVKPIDGNDTPSGRFEVELQAAFNTSEAAKHAEEDKGEKLVEFVRERFGRIENRPMMTATNIRVLRWEGFNVPFLGQNLGGGRKATIGLIADTTPATLRFWPHKLTVLVGAVPILGRAPLYKQIHVIEAIIIGGMGSNIALHISIVITAFFIPNMLRKGTVDLLCVKPISRPALLIYKYIGGLTFIFFNSMVAIGGVWLAVGLRSGVWAPTFLLMIFVLTFFFAVLYAVSALFGVLTRSPIASILLTVAFWAVMFTVGILNGIFESFRGIDRMAEALHEKLGDEGLQALQNMAGAADGPEAGPGRRRVTLEDLRFHENWFTRTITVLYRVLPRTTELDQLLDKHLQHDLAFGELWSPPPPERPPPELPGGLKLPRLTPEPSPLWITLTVSCTFLLLLLGLASWRFAVRDY